MDTNNIKKPRGGSISREQKRLLIEIMEASEDLRKGKFHPQFTYKDSQLQWRNIEERLNAIPGAKKDWTHWRRTWQDMKKSVKKKNADVKKHVRRTGGGPPTDIIFTEEDENLLQIMDTTALEGDAGVAESEVVFFENEHNYADVEEQSEDISFSYCENDDSIIIENSEKENEETITVEENKKEENKQKKGMKRKRTMATQRLENSQNACEKLSSIATKKVQIKKHYYDQKIEILRQNVIIGNRIATALEKVAESLQHS